MPFQRGNTAAQGARGNRRAQGQPLKYWRRANNRDWLAVDQNTKLAIQVMAIQDLTNETDWIAAIVAAERERRIAAPPIVAAESE